MSESWRVVVTDLTHAADGMGREYTTKLLETSLPGQEAAMSWCENDFVRRGDNRQLRWELKPGYGHDGSPGGCDLGRLLEKGVCTCGEEWKAKQAAEPQWLQADGWHTGYEVFPPKGARVEPPPPPEFYDDPDFSWSISNSASPEAPPTEEER